MTFKAVRDLVWALVVFMGVIVALGFTGGLWWSACKAGGRMLDFVGGPR